MALLLLDQLLSLIQNSAQSWEDMQESLWVFGNDHSQQQSLDVCLFHLVHHTGEAKSYHLGVNCFFMHI